MLFIFMIVWGVNFEQSIYVVFTCLHSFKKNDYFMKSQIKKCDITVVVKTRNRMPC